MQQAFRIENTSLIRNKGNAAKASCFKLCVSLQRRDWIVEKSKTQIHLDKHWLCSEYPGLFGPLPGLIISTYLSGRAPHPSSPILWTFNAPHLEGYIKKELTNSNIQHQSEPGRCSLALPTRGSCLRLRERVRKVLFIFQQRSH